MFRSIRDYFENHGFLEADTPFLTPSPIPESHIELFRTRKIHPDGAEGDLYLVPSPEVWLKMLLASGSPSLFQIGKCFRNGEQLDRWHRNEFTMLEWYSLHYTAMDNLTVMQDLLTAAVQAVNPRAGMNAAGQIREVSMEEAFRDYAGFSLESDLRESGLSEINRISRDYPMALNRISEIFRQRLKEKNLPVGNGEKETADDLFHRIFLTLVEENLPADRPLALNGWPSFIPTLARNIPGTPWADRWELYIRGVEVANCYGEETDEDVLKSYWESESLKINGKAGMKVTQSQWPGVIARGMPPCSGAAVGLERLQALLRGDDSLQGLDIFPIHDSMPR